MRSRTLSMITVLGLLVCVPAYADAPKPAISADESAANGAMAERLAQMAQASLAGKQIVPATLRQSAALLEQACALNPREARFPRLLTEAYLQLMSQLDKEGQPIDDIRTSTLASLKRYMDLEPSDQPAKIQYIDLQNGKFDSGDARKAYLNQLVNSDQLPAEVRSHAAVLMAQLAVERAEPDESAQFVDVALRLFPLSPEALRMKYGLLTADTPPAQRSALLVQILRSNPSQPWAMNDLARTLAGVGLVDLSLNWSQTAFALTQRMGMPPNLSIVTGYAAELVVADQLTTAQAYVKKLVEADPTNSDAAFLSLLIAKRGAKDDEIAAAVEATRGTLNTRLSRISDTLNSRQPAEGAASTQPVSNIDIPGDIKLLTERKDIDLTANYAAGLADQAWLDIYFNNKPADAQGYLEALRHLIPADSAILARLEGWSFLVDNKPAEAKVKLSAIADSDPLARLGMIRIESAELPPDQTRAAAEKLLNENASGVVGAIIIEALRAKSLVGLMPQGPDAAAVRAEVEKFPKDWLDMLDFNSVKKLYALRAEPVKVAHSFGEPVLVKVSITNTSPYDMTLGANGAIRPDLWFDCQIKGIAPQNFPGVAFERLGQRVLLKPKDTITQTARVDQGGLAAFMRSNPQIGLSLYFSVLTNPITLPQSGIAPGPGGYRAQFTGGGAGVVQRTPAPLNDQTLQAAFTQLLSGTGDSRVRNLDMLGTYVKLMRAQAGAQAQLAGKATEIADVIRKSTGDSVPAVRAQATYMTAALADQPVRDGIIKQMLADSAPILRVVGLAVLQDSATPEQRKEMAKPLATGDPDPIVKALAQSVIEVADLPPPQTQPTTEPTTAPTDPTAAGK